jgi:polysaccharide pyruvyl transferase WcaK-like protein
MNKLKFGHIGSYNRNLGDNIALLNVRNEFNKYIDNIEWVSLDIHDIFWSRGNNPEFTINFINQHKFDHLVIGGGGLIEYKGYEHHQTNYKLPFNKEILTSLNCPTYFIGLGINYFRGLEGFSDKAKQSLSETIEYSKYFSLRNDGSLNILKELDLYSNKVKEIPDPGLIYSFEKTQNSIIKNNYIQPSFNSNEDININRFKSISNIKDLVKFSTQNQLTVVPHTPKDYRYFQDFLFDKEDLQSYLEFNYTRELIKTYLNFDSIIAMRGHGQLISIGLNVPGIYLSTQDKVKDFSLLNGFENYNIDIEENNWFENLNKKYKQLLNDPTYLENWYSIRNSNIEEWKNVFKNEIKKCIS